jgi:hypothetical protein
MLAQLSEAGDSGRAAASLMAAIDGVAKLTEQQGQEARAARAMVARLTAENAQLRQLLKQLLGAVETSGITAAAAIETADRRLRDLVQADAPPVVRGAAAPGGPRRRRQRPGDRRTARRNPRHRIGHPPTCGGSPADVPAGRIADAATFAPSTGFPGECLKHRKEDGHGGTASGRRCRFGNDVV